MRKARKDPSYGLPIRGKRVLITGSSSGIGEHAAYRFGKLGAHVLLVARRAEELEAVAERIRAAGGQADFFPCDLRDLDALDALVADVVAKHGGVDVLINNAGHSIRRRTVEQLERWHDVERTMQINYFSAMRLIRGFLPGMIERGDGHVISVASWGVVHEVNPRFAPYIAAKSALAQVTRTIGTELLRKGVHGTTLYFPLVRTPMIAPTEEYNELPALTSDEAAEWMELAARTRPVRVVAKVSWGIGLFNALVPKFVNSFLMREAGRR
ncbi:MAG: SDR family oxidoreductase [Segniliparus sp.]|uniref:SDR family oxidoreductase n=1 Tax=Segniliparus sp. TaxID=2804064 RepID=UPI003F2BD34E